jgi:hypothetical protein
LTGPIFGHGSGARRRLPPPSPARSGFGLARGAVTILGDITAPDRRGVGRDQVRLRLDTHVLIWLSEGDAARGPSVRRRIDEAGAGPGVLVPPLSFWDRPVKRP